MYLFSDADGNISTQPPQISFLDHGFLFGDSIYEVVRLYDGRLFGWDEHMDRLRATAERLNFPLEKFFSQLRGRALSLLKKFGEKNACFRIIITRGPGKLHIDPRSCENPQIYMAAWKYDRSMRPDPAHLYIPNVRRNDRRTLDPAIKSGNYLNSVMALQEALQANAEDALMLNVEGHFTELTTSNIGWIRNGRVETPSTRCGILHGVTRRFLMKTTEVTEVERGIEVLDEVDEVFILSTLKEALPVREISSASGKTWKWSKFDQTLLIQEKLRHTIEKELEKQERLV